MRKLFASLTGIAIAGALVTMSHPAAAAGTGPDQQVTITLKGSEEVPNPGDPDATGTAIVTFKTGSGEICWDIKVANIVLPSLGSHIHEGKQGVAGPIVVPFAPEDVNGVANGCTKPDAALMARIMQTPENFYVNVHSTEFPAGALRGQLMTLTDVAAPPTPMSTLPNTGAESGMWSALAGLALVAVVVGVSLTMGARRRTTTR